MPQQRETKTRRAFDQRAVGSLPLAGSWPASQGLAAFLMVLVLAPVVVAQPPTGQQPAALQPAAQQAATQLADGDPRATAPASPIDDPYRAYEAGQYEQALSGLIDLQVERPEDPDLLLSVGSAQYQLKDYEASQRSYSRAAQTTEPQQRAEALYNLGNTAYRQGRLVEAIERYQAALDLTPDDEDAKFNLEFVREELRRRQEEAQKRQQDQAQDQQQQDQQQQDGQEGESQDQQQGEPAGDQGQDADGDGDGLPDEVERMGKNPTDPANPDTDGDGRPDGQEDSNQNGQLDPGETDPNVADGEQEDSASEDQAESGGGQGQQTAPSGEREMTPAEAERFLQALEEHRPTDPERSKPGRRAKVAKDW